MCFTFGADVSTRNAHLDAVVLHLHLVAGARSDAGAVVHHEIICKNNSLHVNSACKLARHRNTQYRWHRARCSKCWKSLSLIDALPTLREQQQRAQPSCLEHSQSQLYYIIQQLQLLSCLIVRSLSTLLKVLPTGWSLGMPKICNAHENPA